MTRSCNKGFDPTHFYVWFCTGDKDLCDYIQDMGGGGGGVSMDDPLPLGGHYV